MKSPVSPADDLARQDAARRLVARMRPAGAIRTAQKPVNIVMQAVGEAFDVEPEAMRSATAARTLSVPRWIAMYLLRTDHGMSANAAGRALGYGDHTSALHATQRLDHMLESGNAPLADVLRAVRARALELELPSMKGL